MLVVTSDPKTLPDNAIIRAETAGFILASLEGFIAPESFNEKLSIIGVLPTPLSHQHR